MILNKSGNHTPIQLGAYMVREIGYIELRCKGSNNQWCDQGCDKRSAKYQIDRAKMNLALHLPGFGSLHIVFPDDIVPSVDVQLGSVCDVGCPQIFGEPGKVPPGTVFFHVREIPGKRRFILWQASIEQLRRFTPRWKWNKGSDRSCSKMHHTISVFLRNRCVIIKL